MKEGDRIRMVAEAVEAAAIAGGNAYCGKIPGQRAIVDGHFTRGAAARYGYPPLSPKYAAWKIKHFGRKPMLVLTGMLRAVVKSGTATVRLAPPNVLVIFHVPDYGSHQIAAGRDFLSPSEQDRALVVKAMRQHMEARIAVIKAASVANPPTTV